eukprot:TRINITY_DN18797_c0_g1_i1.p1 TRINITY_DN18797_c0_g1~~TRINITY_DN18797_c0_g1_i1.p1  ORF type:complete len:308 (-),score=48.72 TRINITY_DN18797_c0_g1_i1:15-902(-)
MFTRFASYLFKNKVRTYRQQTLQFHPTSFNRWSYKLALGGGVLSAIAATTIYAYSEEINDEEKMFVLKTHFTLDELHKRADQFKHMYPNGMTLRDFAKLSHITDLTHANMIFHAIDTDHNGVVDWKEWLLYASIISSGSPEEKLDFQFHVYDLDEDGTISFKDLTSILKMHIRTGHIPPSALRQHDHYWQTEKRTPEQLCFELMEKCSLNHDMRITRTEFSRLSKEILSLINHPSGPPVTKIPDQHLDRDLQNFVKQTTPQNSEIQIVFQTTESHYPVATNFIPLTKISTKSENE